MERKEKYENKVEQHKCNCGCGCGCDCKPIYKDTLAIAKNSLDKVKITIGLSEFFKTFADTTRLRIMIALDSAESMCVSDIAVALNMTKSAISHQLKYLKDCNLLRSDKSGKEVFYSLADDHVRDIIEKGIEHIQEKLK